MGVIIVGAGITGATLALAISVLTKGSIEVDLIEAMNPDLHGYSDPVTRTIALAQGTCQQLARIRIWESLRDCATAINHIHVSDRGHAGFVNLHAQDHKVAALGQVIELQEFSRRLFLLLAQAPNVTLHCPARVVEVLRTDSWAEVSLNNGKRIGGQLLVAADGSQSALAQACNMEWRQSDYSQLATTANIITEQDPKGRAFERFTRYGPIAMLPISQGHSSLVWCHDRDQCDHIDTCDDNHFIKALQNAFGWRLGRILTVGKRHSYPLSLMSAKRHISHRLALVGNAAQTLHPVAGQGFNLGLRDAISLAETLAEAANNSEDLGGYEWLSCYQRRRKQDQQATIAMTDGLIHLFANHHTPLVIGRKLGLFMIAHLSVMRNALAKHALGWVKR